jgi:zinc transport system permease protein
MMGISTALCAIFSVTGLWLSYTFDLTSGASIIMVAAAGFFMSFIIERLSLIRSPEKESHVPSM